MELNRRMLYFATFCILAAAGCFWGLFYLGNKSQETNKSILVAAQNLYKTKVQQVPMVGDCKFTGPRILSSDSTYTQVFVYVKDCPGRGTRFEEYLFITCSPNGVFDGSYDLKGKAVPICRATEWLELK